MGREVERAFEVNADQLGMEVIGIAFEVPMTRTSGHRRLQGRQTTSSGLPSRTTAQCAAARTALASSALIGGPIGVRAWVLATRASSSIGGNTGWSGTT